MIEDCVIIQNAAAMWGGGVYGGTLNNCTILGNHAPYGGGADRCTLNNCTISGNTATYGAGAYDSTVNNCTIVRNEGGGVYCAPELYHCKLNNSIVFYNEGGDLLNCTNVSHTCASNAPEGNGNTTNAPMFINPGSGYGTNHVPGNYRLAPGSPCINAGNNDYVCSNAPPYDLDGYWRIWDGTVDMGAYEYYSIPVPANISASDGMFTNKVLVTWDAVMNATGYQVWRYTNDNSSLAVLLDTPNSTTYDDTSAAAGVIYYYWVAATNIKGVTGLISNDIGWRSIAAAITVQPQSLIRTEGETASMSITATGSEPLYYQWQKDGSDILGATSSTYTIAAVAMSDAGAYRCIVTNIASAATSVVATLTVNTRPGIGLSTTLLTYATTYGSSPSAQTLVLTNYGEAACVYSNVITYGTQGGGWFNFAPVTGLLASSSGQVLTGVVNSSVLMAGVYYATNTVIAPAATNSPQSVSVVLVVSKADQTGLTFQPASPQACNTTNGLSASGGSGEGAWSYSIVSGEGEIVGLTNLWMRTGSGTVRVRATKAADANYNEASIEADVVAQKGVQIIDFLNPGAQVETNVLVLNTTASSGLEVTFKVIEGPVQITSGTNYSFLSFTGTGVVSIAASQAGDDNWYPAGLTNTFNVLAAEIGVVATPVFNPDGGAHHGSSVNVTITCDTPGATIRYTTNGEEPTELSLGLFSGGTVSVPIPGTLKAKAWKVGMNPSAVKSAIYTVALRPPAAPVNVAASDGTFTNKITVEWAKAARAAGYRIFRHTSGNAAAADEIGTSTATAYNDTTAITGKTYYYWVKAFNAAGASGLSKPDTGYLGVVGPLITANGMVGDNVRVSSAKPITVTAAMTNLPAAYLGYDVDWWVAAYVQKGGLWFYFDPEFNLLEFDINQFNCRPAYQGPLYNVPPQTLVENLRLEPGVYQVWFAVDYPMNGAVNLTPGYYLMDCMTLTVE